MSPDEQVEVCIPAACSRGVTDGVNRLRNHGPVRELVRVHGTQLRPNLHTPLSAQGFLSVNGRPDPKPKLRGLD